MWKIHSELNSMTKELLCGIAVWTGRKTKNSQSFQRLSYPFHSSFWFCLYSVAMKTRRSVPQFHAAQAQRWKPQMTPSSERLHVLITIIGGSSTWITSQRPDERTTMSTFVSGLSSTPKGDRCLIHFRDNHPWFRTIILLTVCAHLHAAR